jgi:YD repeat-containing protein
MAQLAGQPLAAEQYQQLSFTTDELGQLITEQNHDGPHHYQYDALGNLLTHTLPDGNQLSYFYYGSGHLSQLNFKTPDKVYEIADYERDRLHREIKRRQGHLTQTLTFDRLGRMTAKRTYLNHQSNHASPLIDKCFDYDHANNLIQQVNGYGNDPTHTLDQSARYSQCYQYDAAHQVIQQRQHHDWQRFIYDPAGNLLNQQGQLSKGNQLQQYNGYHYRYDGFGRLIERQRPSDGLTQHFSYNHQHQLIEARVDSHLHRSMTRYQYDALGRRLSKTTEQYDKYSRQHTTTRTDFSWQGLRLSGERSSAQPLRQIRYIYNEQSYEPIAKIISDCHPQTGEIEQQDTTSIPSLTACRRSSPMNKGKLDRLH